MKANKLFVYIAAPFFTKNQLRVVIKIENILDMVGVRYFSPRNRGVIMDLKKEDRHNKLKEIYDANINHLNSCNFMIAVIDDHDVGTMFELGHFTLKRRLNQYAPSPVTIVTLTEERHGLNVMLKFGVDCHIHGVSSLHELMKDVVENGISEEVLEDYDDYSEVST